MGRTNTKNQGRQMLTERAISSDRSLWLLKMLYISFDLRPVHSNVVRLLRGEFSHAASNAQAICTKRSTTVYSYVLFHTTGATWSEGTRTGSGVTAHDLKLDYLYW